MEMGAPGSAAEQSPEEIHRLLAAAAVQERPVAARYDGTAGSCVRMWGLQPAGEWRVCCYQYAGETKSRPQPSGDEGIWRCLDKALKSGSDRWSRRTEPQAPSPMLRGEPRGRRRPLSWRRSAERAM